MIMSYDSAPAGISGGKKQKAWSHPDRAWEVRDAMRTIMHAEKYKADAKLMEQVKLCAAEEAQEMREKSGMAAALAKSGKISEKQMAKLKR